MIDRLRRGFELLLETVCIVLLVLLMVIVTLGIVFRTAGHPLVWYDELASVNLAWLTYYGAALAALKRAHIGFNGLVNALPPAVRVPLALFTELLIIVFFLALGWFGVGLLRTLAGETLVSLPLPVAVTQSVIPIGSLLFVIAEILNLPRVLEQARGRGIADPHEPISAAASELTH